jgi:glutathione synthase/RimK-type ligase-like ATP-grasp enzyme
MSRVAIVTCEGADDPDNPTLFVALESAGLDASLVSWDDPSVRWDAFDLVVVRSTWDYPRRRDEFLAWTRGVANLVNPVDIIEYSSDKHYLADLETRGLRIIPSHFCDVGEEPEFFDIDFVVKPCVGAGSLHVERYRPEEVARAFAHVKALHADGRDALIQPYIHSVDTIGERAVIFIDGQYSHAMAKGAMLNVAATERDFRYRRQQMSATKGELGAIDFATEVLSTLEFSDLLYARVDLVATIQGWLVMELEMIEPSLFLTFNEPAADALVAGIVRRLNEDDRE